MHAYKAAAHNENADVDAEAASSMTDAGEVVQQTQHQPGRNRLAIGAVLGIVALGFVFALPAMHAKTINPEGTEEKWGLGGFIQGVESFFGKAEEAVDEANAAVDKIDKLGSEVDSKVRRKIEDASEEADRFEKKANEKMAKLEHLAKHVKSDSEKVRGEMQALDQGAKSFMDKADAKAAEVEELAAPLFSDA